MERRPLLQHFCTHEGHVCQIYRQSNNFPFVAQQKLSALCRLIFHISIPLHTQTHQLGRQAKNEVILSQILLIYRTIRPN